MSEPKKPGNIFGTCSKPQLFWLKRDEPNFVPKPVPFIERLRNLKSGNFEFACSRILAFPFDVGFGLGDPIVVDLDQHGADKSD